MDFEEIEFMLTRYFSQSANMADLEVLNNWIEEPENQLIFREYVKTHFAITLAMNEHDVSAIREAVLKEMREDKRKGNVVQFGAVMRYAAIALVFFGVGFFLSKDIFNTTNTIQGIVPRADDITLKLESGEVKIIAADGTSKVYDAKGQVVGEQKGNQIVYTQNAQPSKLVYNTLNVPNGKRFNIMLSDGTTVHLNAGSSFTYPVQFQKNNIRKVFLTGEAYFEVSHIKEHSFIVNANNLDVKVYGTKFNVSSYPEDRTTDVVLVEGSVSLTQSDASVSNENEVFVSPGYKAIFNREERKISNEKVVTSLYTSWMSGNLVFRQESFQNIIQKLQRHYNVIIINNNEKLANEAFNATIETDRETIEQVFNYFKKVHQIEYSIVENKIVIN